MICFRVVGQIVAFLPGALRPPLAFAWRRFLSRNGMIQ
jgi:hypothetical protein